MSTTRRWKRTLLASAILVIGLLGGGTAVWAKSALMQAEISVCLDGSGYLYQPVGGGTCRAGNLTWNQEGPAGPQGPAGQQGQAGPAGPQGPAGPGKTGPPLSSGEIKVVTKTVAATKFTSGKLAGFHRRWIDPVTIACPSGWTLTGSGFAARDHLREAFYHRIEAYPTVDEVLKTSGGRPFAKYVAVVPARVSTNNDDLWPDPWWVTFQIVCMRLT